MCALFESDLNSTDSDNWDARRRQRSLEMFSGEEIWLRQSEKSRTGMNSTSEMFEWRKKREKEGVLRRHIVSYFYIKTKAKDQIWSCLPENASRRQDNTAKR